MCRLTQIISRAAIFAAIALVSALAQTAAPVVTPTNFNVRVMAANISSGNLQRYEAPGLRIFQGLKPDIVAVQEFNYASTGSAGINTTSAFREMVDTAFGTNFHYCREAGSYSIPNGIISRWPILQSGSWEDIDTGVNDRGFAWAKIGVPGTNDFYVVSVHLKASSDSAARRAAEAAQLQSLIQSPTNFSPNAFIIVAGDLNIDNSTEQALAIFRTFLSDTPAPTDGVIATGTNTNAGRSERYDYVLPSFNLAARQVPTVIGANSFSRGLVFDSQWFQPLTAVSPVAAGDSHVTGMQHMAVVKDFGLSASVTNYVAVPRPVVVFVSTNVLGWTGPASLTYTVQASSNLTTWATAGAATSATTSYRFTNLQHTATTRFFRVVWP